MNLKNNEITRKRAQSVIEYVLLVAISISALIVCTNVIGSLKSNAFKDHFDEAAKHIGGIIP